MSKYLLIETRDPFATGEVRRAQELALGLAREQHEVTLFLVENGVFASRESSASRPLFELAQGGVRVLADTFSLQERGIDPARVVSAVQPASLDVVIDHLAAGAKVLWH